MSLSSDWGAIRTIRTVREAHQLFFEYAPETTHEQLCRLLSAVAIKDSVERERHCSSSGSEGQAGREQHSVLPFHNLMADGIGGVVPSERVKTVDGHTTAVSLPVLYSLGWRHGTHSCLDMWCKGCRTEDSALARNAETGPAARARVRFERHELRSERIAAMGLPGRRRGGRLCLAIALLAGASAK